MKTKLQLWGIWDSLCESVALKQGWDNNTDYWECADVQIEPIPYQDDFIDAVLFFADGCVEFHFQDNGDAENWSRFSIEMNEQVLERITIN